jgi:hypothetical protein
MHGGPSTGPRTPEGLARSRRANWKTGKYSAENKASLRFLRLAWRVFEEIGVFPRKRRCRAKPLTVGDLAFLRLYSATDDWSGISPLLKRSVERRQMVQVNLIGLSGLPVPYAQKSENAGNQVCPILWPTLGRKASQTVAAGERRKMPESMREINVIANHRKQ